MKSIPTIKNYILLVIVIILLSTDGILLHYPSYKIGKTITNQLLPYEGINQTFLRNREIERTNALYKQELHFLQNSNDRYIQLDYHSLKKAGKGFNCGVSKGLDKSYFLVKGNYKSIYNFLKHIAIDKSNIIYIEYLETNWDTSDVTKVKLYIK